MNNQEIKELCIDLAKAKGEEEIINLLKKVGFWNEKTAWEDYDRNPNNFSTIGNQQSSSDTALVEKIINSNVAWELNQLDKTQVLLQWVKNTLKKPEVLEREFWNKINK